METMITADINKFATKIGLTQQELMRQSLISFIFSKLKEIKTELFKLQKKYNVDTVFEFEKLYEAGKIEEANSLKDLQYFDKLSFQQEIYENFLKEIA